MAMDPKNPYNKKKLESKAPMILRVPMHDFDSPEQVDTELLPEELCIARMPNSKPLGYVDHVALVYKSLEGEVFSLTMAQHHGELKPGTAEHFKKLDEEELSKDALPPIHGSSNGSSKIRNFFRKKN